VNAQNVGSTGADAAQNAGINEMLKGIFNNDQGKSTQNMAQMAMGAMQIASGLLGLLASAGMGQKADQNGAYADNMAGLGSDPISYPSGSTSTDASTTGSSSMGDTTRSVNGVGISASDLHTGTVGAALDRIESNYGIPREKLMAALEAGVSPQDIFANAPKNAASKELLGRIAEGLAAGQGGESRLPASPAGVDQGAASMAGTPKGDTSVDPAKAAQNETASEESTEDFGAAAAGPNVSPEVAAALAARAAERKAERDMKGSLNWSLFQLVHDRYKKLEVMLYGRVERTNAHATDGLKN
jgi:hypothetical protein